MLDMQGEEGPTLIIKEMEDPPLDHLEMGMLTLSIAKACLTMLNRWKIW